VISVRRHIVVTGANGLIGTGVVRRLLALGNQVTAIVRQLGVAATPDVTAGISTIPIDLSQNPGSALAAIGAFDGIIHLAQASGWHGFPKRAGAVAALSVAASAYLAEAAIAAGARSFVFASSGGIYGPSSVPLSEDAPIKPAAELGFYLAAKATTEQLLTYFRPHLRVHVLRPFFVYGPGQADTFLIPRLIAAVRNARAVRIDGGRGPRLNPLHVDDAAAAFVAALDASECITANLAGPDIISVREIAEMAAVYFRTPACFEGTDQAPDDYVADIGRMRTQLVAPKVSLAEGLTGMMNETVG
jgi:UDP-glucose 4-epimerase